MNSCFFLKHVLFEPQAIRETGAYDQAALEDQSSFEVLCALWLFQRTGQNLSLLNLSVHLKGSYLKIQDKQVPKTFVKKTFVALLHHGHKYI